MVGDVLGNASFRHPFLQHHLDRGVRNLQVVKDVVDASCLLRHPLSGLLGNGNRHPVLGLYLNMVDVFRHTISRLVYLAPFERLHVTIAQTSEAGEEEGLFHYLVSTGRCHHLFQLLDGQELTFRHSLLRFLLGIQQCKWVVFYQSLPYRLCHDRAEAVGENAAGGLAQCLLAAVERAGFQKGDEALAEILVHLFEQEVGLAYR